MWVFVHKFAAKVQCVYVLSTGLRIIDLAAELDQRGEHKPSQRLSVDAWSTVEQPLHFILAEAARVHDEIGQATLRVACTADARLQIGLEARECALALVLSGEVEPLQVVL